ncbi:MAG: hypothetical protein ACK5MR_02330 [Cumulibacter sp.]
MSEQLTTTETSAGPTTVDTADQSPTAENDKLGKLIGIILGLTVMIGAMLLAFATPQLNSGARDLPLAVSGNPQAIEQVTAQLAQGAADTFDITTYATADEGAEAIKNRDAVGGIALTGDGVTIQTAAGAGASYKMVLTSIGAQLEAAGQQVTYVELAPTTADDPSGNALVTLGMPLIFGGMAGGAVLYLIYKGSLRNRLLGATAFAITGGLAATAILQYGFGAFDGDYWLTSLAVTAGIMAISYLILGLSSIIGYAGLGIVAVLMMFVSNPLSGLATGPDWLPAFWGDLGQFLPVGAAGTAIRSSVYFDGAGATQAWIVLACWIALGLGLAVLGARRRVPVSAH